MTTPNTEIGAITTTVLRVMRQQLEEAAAIARAAEALATDGQPGRALAIEPFSIEANQLLQALAILTRIAREEQEEARP